MQVNTGAVAGRIVVLQRLHAAGRPSTLRAMNNIASRSQNGRVTTCASGHQRSNPSIERTHNGGAQCLAPSRVVPPLCAAHVKR